MMKKWRDMPIWVTKIMGKPTILDFEEFDAACVHSSDLEVLLFPGGLSGRFECLRLLMHEMDHLCYPELTEEQVDQGSRDKARVLWDLKYRLQKRRIK
jgi:hypothetical protein